MKMIEFVTNLCKTAEYSAKEVGKLIGGLQDFQDELIHQEIGDK